MNEEDIKIIEKIKEEIDTDYGSGRRKVAAIENLININKELEEEVERRIEQKVLDYRYVDKNMLRKDIIQRDYIPKSKIKEKIEELKQERTLKYDNYMGYKIESREQQDIDKKVQVLEELLEKRK